MRVRRWRGAALCLLGGAVACGAGLAPLGTSPAAAAPAARRGLQPVQLTAAGAAATVAAAKGQGQVVISLSSATAAAVGQVESWAAAQGFTAAAIGTTAVVVHGAPDALATAFGTTLVRTASATYPASPLAVPIALAPVAGSAVGLDTRPRMRPARAASISSTAATQAQLAQAYDATPGGANVTIASVQFQDWNSGDAVQYAQQNGITLPSIQTVVVESPPSDADGSNTETALDVEALMTAAPQAAQLVYESNGDDATGIVSMWAQLLTDAQNGRFQILSTSWGECEHQANVDGSFSVVETYIQKIVAAGVTVVAASGDSGTDDCYPDQAGDPSTSVDYPASSRYVVGVGGTSLGSSGETAWPSSGGGASNYWTRPSYQANVGYTGTTRLVPDIAADGDPQTGLNAVVNGATNTLGGTSLSAPLVAGYLADVAAQSKACASASTCVGLGDVHGTLYANTGDFHDVTSPSPARAGYDLITGLGSPDFGKLSAALLGAAPTTRPTAPSTGGGSTTSPPVSAAPDTTPPGGSVKGALLKANRATSVLRLTSTEPVTWSIRVMRAGRKATLAATVKQTSATAISLPLQPGTYTVYATPTDYAGNTGKTFTSTWSVPMDDRDLLRSVHWSARHLLTAYAGTVLTSSTVGARAQGSAYGRTATIGYVCQRGGGDLVVTVDGNRKTTLDLFCTKPRERTATVKGLKLANHTVSLQLLAGPHGHSAELDDLLVKP